MHEAQTSLAATPVSPYQPGPPYPISRYPSAAAAPPPRPPWHQRWWAVGGAALAVLLVGCLGGSAVAVLTNPDAPAAAPTPAATATGQPGPSGSGGLAPGAERAGEGSAIVALDLPAGAVHTVTITFTGTDLFQATLVDDGGELVGFLGSGSGDHTSTHLIGEGLGTSGIPAAVDIVDADGGSWRVLVQDLSDAPAWPAQTAGTGSLVLRVDPDAVRDPVPVTGTHTGASNFIVWAYAEDDLGDRLLFNEIGQFSGPSQEDLTGDAFVLAIQADGDWSINRG